MKLAKSIFLTTSIAAALPLSTQAAINWNGWSHIEGENGHAVIDGVNENFDRIKENITSVDSALTKAKEAQDAWNKEQEALNKEQGRLNEEQSKWNQVQEGLNEKQKEINQEQHNWNEKQEGLNQKQKEINHQQSLQNDQFRRDINKLNDRVTGVENTMKKGFASQAALSGLFQPYGIGKANLSLAFGGYESHSAIAVGSGYRFNENVALKSGVATNTEDFTGLTYSAGVNFEW
ncbi:YadA C-terminal domain-containing protein [Enterobacter cloacae]